jgi:hypothetical protein
MDTYIKHLSGKFHIYLHVLFLYIWNFLLQNFVYIFGSLFFNMQCAYSQFNIHTYKNISQMVLYYIHILPTLNLISTRIKTFPQRFYIIFIYVYDKMFNSTFHVFQDYIFTIREFAAKIPRI